MADADALREAGVPGRPPAEPTQPRPPTVPPTVPPPGSPPPAATSDDSTVMSLVDHLSELRTRLFRIILGVVIGGAIGWMLSEQIIAILRDPIPGDSPLFFTGLGDAFVIRLKVALVVGVVLSMPWILYQVWAFVAPGLTPSERRVVRPWVPFALLFFAIGVALAYVVLPFAAEFLVGFRTDDLQPLITAGAYFDFVTTMFIVFGLVMEFPILLFGLSRVGIVTSDRLRAARRYVVLGIAVFAAIATPGGDLVSPFALGLTMYVLYELTLVAIRRSGR